MPTTLMDNFNCSSIKGLHRSIDINQGDYLQRKNTKNHEEKLKGCLKTGSQSNKINVEIKYRRMQ